MYGTHKVQGVHGYKFEQSVVEKLASLVNQWLYISFQKAYKSAFLVRFVILHIHPWLHACWIEMPGI